MDGLTRVDYPDGNYVSYKYDKSNRLTKVSTAFGDTSYQYDAFDRITRVVDRNGYATVYEYDANGNRTAVKYANGLTVSYEYDKLNRLICEETVDSDSNLVVKYVYTLGASGERIKVEELDRTVEYTYDELYRLTSETITKGKNRTTYAYEYDSVSNRTLKNVNGVETVYTYNSLNQLISENNITYEYDNAGNLVRVVGAGKTALYVYNADNKLVKATVQQGDNVVVETYTYDYAGNRTSKTTSTNNHVEKVYYLNDNSSLTNVLVEIGTNGDEICYYTIGADLLSQEIDGEVYVYLYDGHGTVRALANSKGKVTDTYTYDAFGNLISSTGSTANNYRYCGEQFDSTTCLYYLRARYMDTNTGRFISQDSYAGSTADPISLHKYLYANSNPVTYIDPSGYFSLGEMAGVMAISGIIGGMSCGAMNVFRFLWDKSYEGNATNWWQAFAEGANAGIWSGFLAGGWMYMAAYSVFIALIVAALSGCSAYQLFTSACDKFQSGNNGGAVIDYLMSLLSAWSMFYFGYSAYPHLYAWAANNITTAGLKPGFTNNSGANNAANAARLKESYKVQQLANDIIDSLNKDGKLPPEYITKFQAEGYGWGNGKALNNYAPGKKIGGGVFHNDNKVLPTSPGRIWYEADVGIDYNMSRSNPNNSGYRILFSNDGLIFGTFDHYKTVFYIGKYK